MLISEIQGFLKTEFEGIYTLQVASSFTNKRNRNLLKNICVGL